jgi:hypothetical protein
MLSEPLLIRIERLKTPIGQMLIVTDCDTNLCAGDWAAAAHKRQMRQRLKAIVERLGIVRPDELASQLSLLINGAFVSSQILEPGEATPLLRRTAHALIEASRT